MQGVLADTGREDPVEFAPQKGSGGLSRAGWAWVYVAVNAVYILLGMVIRIANPIDGDTIVFVQAARRVLDGSFDLYSFLAQPISAPPLGTGYSYSPFMAMVIAPVVGLADSLGWGDEWAQRLMALPLLFVDVIALHQLRGLVRRWRPGVDERFLLLGTLITFFLTSLWLATAWKGHDEGLMLLFLVLTIRFLPDRLLLSGLCAGLTLAAKHTSMLMLIPVGLVLLFVPRDAVPVGDRGGVQRTLTWAAIAVGVFALFMLPAVISNPDAVYYAFVTAMARLMIFGPSLPSWINEGAMRFLSPEAYSTVQSALLAYSNVVLLVVVVAGALFAAVRASRRGRPIGLTDPRLLALVAFGSASQIVFGKWIGGHYYVMPLALVFLWDVVRTAPVEAPDRGAGMWARKAWAGVPVVGLGSAIIFRSVTQWDPWWFKLSLMGLLFVALMVITLRAALSETSPNPDSYNPAVT